MKNVLDAAAELQEFCRSHQWRFCFIGGIAVLRWGEPRITIDADLTLLTGFGSERRFLEPLLERFPGRIPDAEAFALEHRVLLLRSDSGVGLDVALGALPYEELVVKRSSIFAYTDAVSLQTCSAEDLVVLKAFAGRTQDWADVERLILRQSHRLDWGYVIEQLRPLAELKDDPKILDELERRRLEI